VSLILGSELKASLYDGDDEDKVIRLRENDWRLVNKIGVFPLKPDVVTPIGVDLTVGEFVYRHSDGLTHRLDPRDAPSLTVEPGDTAIILTAEFIVMPPDVGALVMAKARFVWEGLSQGTTKVDPTWYGCLHVTITNMTRNAIDIRVGEPFCTLLFFRLPESVESPLGVEHLGQRNIVKTWRRAKPWSRRPKEDLHERDFTLAVERFGPPLDVIDAKFEWTARALTKNLEEKLLPKLRSDISSDVAWRQNTLLFGLVCLLLGAVVSFLLTRAVSKDAPPPTTSPGNVEKR